MIDLVIALFAMFLGEMTDGEPSPVPTDDNAQEAYADSLRY